MAATFYVRTKKATGFATLFVRLQSSKQKIDYKLKTPLEVNWTTWKNAQKGPTARDNFRKANPDLCAMMDKIKAALELTEQREVGITAEEMTAIINDTFYREEKAQEARNAEEQAKAEAEAKKLSIIEFMDKFVEDIRTGGRQTDKGLNYAPATVKSIKASVTLFKLYQKSKRRIIKWDDIDMQFYYDYTAWLKKKDYSVNTIGKNVKQLKALLAIALSEGHHSNVKYQDKKFKGTRIEVDSIYLTKEDLEKFTSVDISNYGIGHDQARDIFMVGVWTAQRVSDYNNISKEDIQTYQTRSIVDEPDPENPGKTIAKIVTRDITVINVRQKKTDAKVTIPCSSALKKILEKYDYQLPHLEDQVINRYIKEIAEKAGLTETIEIKETKGGTPKLVKYKKYELIHTHTARRTGATLMYLSGMDIYDIMKITGHTSPSMLKKYIKADQLEVVDKIVAKYNYFD